MPGPVDLLHGWLVLLLVERALELVVSARHERRLRATGAVERGAGHYPAMVALHAAFLAGCAAEPALWPRPWPAWAALLALAAAALAQGLRWWAVTTLGGRWTTRVLVPRDGAPVTGGPYRFLRHPNYLAVALELLAVPLIGGAVATAAAATLGNAVLLLAFRIPAEETALGPAWRAAFGPRDAVAADRGPAGEEARR